MLTELQKRKWTRLFQVYDINGNGVVGQSDFEIVFENLAKARNLEPNSSEYNQLRTKFMENWEHFRRDTDTDKDGKIQLNEWLEHGDRRIQNPSMYKTVVELAHKIFDLFDQDGDGVISIDEYKKILSSWQVTEEVAKESFPKLDFNGDGHISKEEYVELIRQFHMSNQPEAPGNLFFGPY